MAEETAAATAAPPRNDAGVARIKPEYRLERSDDPNSLQSDAANDDTAEESGKSLKRTTRDDGTEVLADDAHGEERGDKRTRGNDSKRGKAKGMNKGRKFSKIFGSVEICQNWAATQTCHYGESCRKGHDLKAYLDSKPADMHFPRPNSYSVDPPFVLPPAETDPILCPTFEELGFCPQGFKCRYLAGHLTKPTSEKEDDVGTIVIDYEKKERLEKETGASKGELNWVNQDAQRRLKENSYEFKIADAYLKKINGEAPVRKAPKKQAGAPAMSAEDEEMEAMMAESRTDADKDIPDGPMRPEEKRRLHWKGKTYLAPLTTTGNLPFRRLCVSLGADITCSEMGLAEGFLKGTKGEWALTKRHTSERDFGIQVAGSKPVQLVPTAEAIARECPSIDFVDVNLGCPIDLVFNKGAGSALFDAPTKLGKILVGMSHALGEIPLTVKMRTGIKNNLKQAHTLIPRFATEWGANAMTLHGRSRQQRYSKSADWNYIRECADTLRATVEEANLPMIPIFGNGDCFSAQQYYEDLENSGVDGIMVARGALIKPWIFTEIKEKREWDISSRERLDLIRNFAEFGLSHWGSDITGINTTRRFLCESLSFTCRYTPLGILEHVPAKINDRPEPFKGRDPLETLLSSGHASDWVKITEMFLGPCDADFKFVPKHKSASGGGEEGNG